MTKQHFEWAAKQVRSYKDLVLREILADNYAALFQEFNPRFNREQFLAACRGEAYTNPVNGRTSHYDQRED